MYRTTWSRFDALTLKAPYPSCQENRSLRSVIHLEEFAFNPLHGGFYCGQGWFCGQVKASMWR